MKKPVIRYISIIFIGVLLIHIFWGIIVYHTISISGRKYFQKYYSTQLNYLNNILSKSSIDIKETGKVIDEIAVKNDIMSVNVSDKSGNVLYIKEFKDNFPYKDFYIPVKFIG